MKTIIERGASWTLEETKLLLSLWGQDLVQRKVTGAKRTREVYEKISEKFQQNGYERTAEQVRTRVFNMIAEYRRILKDPNPDRKSKCIFYEPLHKIYEAQHMEDVKSALDDYEPEYPYSPVSNTISDKGEESITDSEAMDGQETMNNNNNINNISSNIPTLIATNSTTTPSSNTSSKSNAKNTATSVGSNIATDTNGESGTNDSSTERDSITSSPNIQGHKKIKLDSPKSNQTQTTPTGSGQNSNNSNENSSSKQGKSSTTNNSALPLASASGSSTPGGPRQQSLLMPHGNATSANTPVSKIPSSGGNNTPSYININSTKVPIIRANQLIGHPNGTESLNMNGTASRLSTTAAIASHQLYQAPVNTFDVTSSALLIDRMFAHLSRESENMREWIALEKERLTIERQRRQQEAEREIRRERVMVDTLMRFQEQWLEFISKLDPRIIQNAPEAPPELNIPSSSSGSLPKETYSNPRVPPNPSVSQASSDPLTTANNATLNPAGGNAPCSAASGSSPNTNLSMNSQTTE